MLGKKHASFANETWWKEAQWQTKEWEASIHPRKYDTKRQILAGERDCHTLQADQ